MLTIDPGDDYAFREGQQHEREGGAIPVHDLQNVDSTLHTTHTSSSSSPSKQYFVFNSITFDSNNTLPLKVVWVGFQGKTTKMSLIKESKLNCIILHCCIV